uniref:Uncharacterized protein n=2 Tax=Aegilops tauschii subsp. strangulata TaxID=200361 RepID=A0A453QTK0_AEGTS
MLTLTGLATGFVHMLHDAEQKLSNPCLPSPDHALALVPLPGLHRHACCPGDVHHGVRRHLLLQAQARRGGCCRGQSRAHDGAARGQLSRRSHCRRDERRRRKAHTRHAHSRDARMRRRTSIAMHMAMTRVMEKPCMTPTRTPMGARRGRAKLVMWLSRPDELLDIAVHKILEMGIVSHSVIIGLSLGVSQSPCTIKPLVLHVNFHQFFEGFALGGCISELSSRISLHS